MNQRSSKIAFAFDGYLDQQLKNDPQYVRWIFRLHKTINNETSEQLLDYHECTDADLEEFHPISKLHQETLARTKERPDQAFFCLNWDDEEPFLIYGKEQQA